MAAYSNKFKCVLHFNTFKEDVIMYYDITYPMLLEFVMKRFNLNPNIWLKFSFTLPVIEREIIHDVDVEFLINYATNSLNDEITHLYVSPPKKPEARITPNPAGIFQKALLRTNADIMAGGHDNIMTTHEYVKKVNENVFEDDHFTLGPWLSTIVHLHGEGVMPSGCLGDMKKFINGKLKLVVAVVMNCTPKYVGRHDSYTKRSNMYNGISLLTDFRSEGLIFEKYMSETNLIMGKTGTYLGWVADDCACIKPHV
nr:hypothetical protein [Tanacetum cinerariifolium]